MGANANLAAAQFNMVASEGMDIQSIIPVAPEGEEASLCFQIQTVTPGMETSQTYVYMNQQDAIDNSGDEEAVAGWYNEDLDTYISYTFAAGEGFVFVSDFGEGAKVQTAGQVESEAQLIPLVANANLCGNNRPVALGIQEILPVAPEGEEASLCFQIQTVTSGMETEATYVYMNQQDAIDNSGDEEAVAGWYNEDLDTYIVKEFVAGAGFIVVSDFESDAFVKLPGIALQ